MLIKLLECIRRYGMMQPGDSVTCAVSGGADSMALLMGLYLLREKLQINLSAAHFNHGLRGEESDRDEAFVRDFCDRLDIPFSCGRGQVCAGKKGLEAAARDARYAYLKTLPGKIATAHTANDNAETVLMHMVRGTGLKGLGGITPVNGKLIRPLLTATRSEVLAFLAEYHVGYVSDSTNQTDDFLRNRLRHHVMPLLEQENPRLAENLSAMAMELREDEAALSSVAEYEELPCVQTLRQMPRPLRARMLMAFLERSGVNEPEREHVALAESLVFSDKPSARASFPGGVTVCRKYDRLEKLSGPARFSPVTLACPGVTDVPELYLRVFCQEEENGKTDAANFFVKPVGKLVLRPRREGDTMRLRGGTKSLKKLFIDNKIPASRRDLIPVAADENGVLGVYGVGANLDRLAVQTGIAIRFEKIEKGEKQ